MNKDSCLGVEELMESMYVHQIVLTAVFSLQSSMYSLYGIRSLVVGKCLCSAFCGKRASLSAACDVILNGNSEQAQLEKVFLKNRAPLIDHSLEFKLLPGWLRVQQRQTCRHQHKCYSKGNCTCRELPATVGAVDLVQ